MVPHVAQRPREKPASFHLSWMTVKQKRSWRDTWREAFSSNGGKFVIHIINDGNAAEKMSDRS